MKFSAQCTEDKPPKRRIYANGHLSEWYRVSLGTAQGCPLSPLLFLIIVEGLTRMIETDDDIIGIKIGDKRYKISHFADDSLLLLLISDVLRFQKHLDTFCEATRMRENQRIKT